MLQYHKNAVSSKVLLISSLRGISEKPLKFIICKMHLKPMVSYVPVKLKLQQLPPPPPRGAYPRHLTYQCVQWDRSLILILCLLSGEFKREVVKI